MITYKKLNMVMILDYSYILRDMAAKFLLNDLKSFDYGESLFFTNTFSSEVCFFVFKLIF